ncbi:MAG: hypothetical protein ACKOYM_07795 [Actinomycetes bacterium]
MDRTEATDLLDEIVAAIAQLGVPARTEDGAVVVDGTRCTLTIVARAHPTPADLTQVVHDHRGQLPAVVVADRISDAGRAVLRDAGWGWLDRRGDVRLWTPGARVEATVPGGKVARSKPANTWTPLGLEIALAAMVAPAEPVTARKVAPKIGRSAGAVHELVGRFMEHGLIGRNTHRPLMPDLFWEAAAHWPDDGWIPLPVGADEVGRLVGPDQTVRVDERAATMGGAKITAAGDLPARLYVTSAGALRKARTLTDRDQPTKAWVRLAPITWLPDNDVHPPSTTQPWRVAHPILCALRLAADPSRGKEIVEAWGLVQPEEPK